MKIEKSIGNEKGKSAIIGFLSVILTFGIIGGIVFIFSYLYDLNLTSKESVLNHLPFPVMFFILLIVFNFLYLFFYLLIFNILGFIILRDKPKSILKIQEKNSQYLILISIIQGLLNGLYFSIIFLVYIFKNSNRFLFILIFCIFFSITHFPLYEIYKKILMKRDDYFLSSSR
ncbi:MAG: hypothetical protein MJB14_00025 [Spirochaetes bacterium]|nr:hypothetical protein [Spirochaetota bacterium]